MATVAEKPAPASSGGRKPLWGDVDIPIIVGTGEFGTGKSTFGLTICPGPETLVYDQEGSTLSYRSLGFHHVDMAVELMKKYPGGFTPQQRWEWWKNDIIERGKSGKYRVAMIDPASELEDGLQEYINKNLNKFDLTLEQVRAAKGLFWGAVKREWKLTLDMLRTYFETIYLTVHLRDEFVGNKPSGKREPKGKETLKELASLFLWFDKEGEKPPVPGANVEKTRLSKFIFDQNTEEWTPVAILPPRLSVATPKKIREYIANPANYDKLKKGEKVLEHAMSEQEKLQLEAQIARDRAEASANELSRMQMIQQQAEADERRRVNAPQTPDRSGATIAAQEAKTEARKHVPVRESQLDAIKSGLAELLGDDKKAWNAWLKPKLESLGVASSKELSDGQADGILSDILKESHAKKNVEIAAKGKELLADSTMGQFTGPQPVPDDVPFDPSEPPGPKPLATLPDPSETVVPVSKEQIDEFRRLTAAVGISTLQLGAMIRKAGAEKFSGLNSETAGGVLAQLQAMLNSKEAEAKKAEEKAAAKPEAKSEPAPTPQADAAPADTSTFGNVPLQPLASSDPALVERLKSLIISTGWSPDNQRARLAKLGRERFGVCTISEVRQIIEELTGVSESFRGKMPGN